jgi:glycosyltransferase involved in cell wall biosynthesis
MRVLQVHNFHAEGPGGAVDVLEQEQSLLTGAGHEVSQYTMPAAQSLGLSAIRAGAKAVWNVEATRQLSRRMEDFRPDVMHVHIPFPLLSPAIFRTAARAGVPAVSTIHNYQYSCIAGTCHRDGAVCEDCVGSRLKLPGLVHRCYHDSLGASGALTLSLAVHRGLGTFTRSVSRFIALTDFSKRLLARDGVPEARIAVKANSVPDPGRSFLGLRPEASVVFAGRLIDLKGVRTLLDAWETAHPEGFRLRIAGDGPLRGLVEQRCAADPSIEYLGWVGQDEVHALMGAAACVVVPSQWYEGQPLVVLRSLAVGTPLLVSDLENICEDVLRDGVGASFRTGDASSLSRALLSLESDPGTWEHRRSLARGVYERQYTEEVNLASLLTIYDDVVSEMA